MTEYFRITGLNAILFDQCATDGDFCIAENQSPEGLNRPLPRGRVLQRISGLPLHIRGHVLNRGISIVTVPCTIRGIDDADMEANEHALLETLEDAALFIGSQGERGTRAELRVKTDNAVASSYKTVYWGELDEGQARAILSGRIKQHQLINCVLTLYCEPLWRPSARVTLGPNEIFCASFEEDGNGDGQADAWTVWLAPVTSMETTIVLQGCYSQQVDTNAANEQIVSSDFVAPAGCTTAVAYAWICRPAAGSDVVVELWDVTVGVGRGQALFSTPGWDTALAKDGINTFYRVAVSSNTIVAGNTYHLTVGSAAVDATTFYVDKCFWLWNVTTVPDEWIGHGLIYNHYDTTEGAAHEGHINYVDVDDLKGDVESRLLMRVEFEQKADEDYARHLWVGRRSGAHPCRLPWWLEAEDASLQSLWADGPGLARCSAGNYVSDNANAAGYVLWYLGAGLLYPSEYMVGRFDVYGVVYTDDIDNTWFRVRSGITAVGYDEQPWRKATIASKWQLIKLGEVNFDFYRRAGYPAEFLVIQAEYEKDPADTARLDFIWPVPKDEPQMYLDNTSLTQVGEWWAMGQTDDFDYAGAEDATPEWDHWLYVKGVPMTLAPFKENRLYFVCESYDSPDTIYEAHGAATDLQMLVSVDYLPQYISPLE